MAVVARYQPVVELCGGDAEVLAGQYHIAGRRLTEDARPRGDELPGLRRGCFVSTAGEHNREDGKLINKIVTKANT